jgi:phosphatidyl-myo-inositol alpha-mannosyltransferase
LRVCIVVPYDLAEEGGVKRNAVHVARSLREMGDEATVVGPLSRGDPGPGFQGFGGVVDIPANGASNRMGLLTSPWKVRRFFREHAFDIVHIHEPLVPLLTYYSLWSSLPSAHVCTFHMYAEHENRAWDVVRKVLALGAFSLFERGMAVSRPAAEHAARTWTGPLTVVPNGVPTSTFRPPAPTGNAPSPDGSLRLLFVGNWSAPRKGLRHLLEAYDRLRARGVAASLDVVGEGAPEAAKRPGVTFHPSVDSEMDLAEHYRRCDVFVAPSTGQESFGIVLLEAMACARPIVCSDIPGYRQVVDPGGSRLVPPGDAGQLADAITELARQPELRRRMGASNCARAQAYDWSLVAQQVRAEYVAAIAVRHGEAQARAHVLPASI